MNLELKALPGSSVGLAVELDVGFLMLTSAAQSTIQLSVLRGKNSVFRLSSMSMICSSPSTGRAWPTTSSYQIKSDQSILATLKRRQ